MAGLILTKLSTRGCLPPNHRPLFRSLSLSSALVTVIFALVLCLSLSAMIFLIAVGDRSYLEVHANVMLSGPASISACILSIPFGYRRYLSRSTPCTLSRCYLWFPVTLMISESHFLAACSSSLQCSRSSMLLVAAGPIIPLNFPFSLHVSLWIPI